MTAERKCPYCDSEEFIEIPLASVCGPDVRYNQNVKSVACVKCGHVDIVVKETVMRDALESAKADKWDDAKQDVLRRRIGQSEEEIERLKAIVRDENQTVKAVKEASERIAILESDVHRMRDELSMHSYRRRPH